MNLREEESECGSFIQLRFYFDLNVVVAADMLDDAKAKTRSTKLSAPCLIDSEETLKDSIQILFWNADATI